jgi:thiamine biosynthesis lipoprotein
MIQLPDAKTAKENVKLINFKNILLNEKELTVMLKEKGMRIGFGGIGKGYAADKAKQILQKEGVESGIVNASGDLTTWGYQANNKAWTVGIANPDQKNTPFSYLNITNMAMATSGNYEKYIMIGGEKYSHTINPKTGFPIKGIKSVTVISPNAEICDALATPISVMGIKAGLNLINQLHQVECIIIDDHNKIYCSNNIRLK